MKIIEQRRIGALLFLYNIGADLTVEANTGLKDYVPQAYRFLKTSTSNDDLCWLLDEEDLVDAGTKLLKEFFERPHQANLLFSLCERNFSKYRSYCEQLNKKRMSNLSTEEIITAMKESFEIYKEIWNVGCSFEFLDFTFPSLLRKEIEQHVPAGQISKVLTTLITSPQDSFSREAEKSLLRIAAHIKEHNLHSPFSKPEVVSMVQEHIDRFYWTSCNYFVFSGLGVNNVQTIITSYLTQDPRGILRKFDEETESLQKEQQNLLKKYPIGERAKYWFKIAQRTSLGLDERKKAQMHGFFAVGRLLKELAKRMKVDFDLAKYIIPPEIDAFAQGKIKVQMLYERRQHSFIDYNTLPLKVLCGEAAKRAEKALWAQADEMTKEIGGVCASPGTITARARVIPTARAIHEIRQGEILVTGMTSPDYVPALNKVVGIITDDGGITCHAAIISRELKLPCIVGTKTATKRIKTGDLVELRANHGLARIIEQA